MGIDDDLFWWDCRCRICSCRVNGEMGIDDDLFWWWDCRCRICSCRVNREMGRGLVTLAGPAGEGMLKGAPQ